MIHGCYLGNTVFTCFHVLWLVVTYYVLCMVIWRLLGITVYCGLFVVIQVCQSIDGYTCVMIVLWWFWCVAVCCLLFVVYCGLCVFVVCHVLLGYLGESARNRLGIGIER